jgi:cell pole-organizing protein PopZ
VARARPPVSRQKMREAMSTANSLPQSQHPSLESEQRAHEPSMEEILASIRRIIADDDALPLMRRPSLVTREPTAVSGEAPSDLPRHPAPAPSAPTVHLVAVPSDELAEEPVAATDAESLDADEVEHAAHDHVAEEYQRRPSMPDLPRSEEEERPSTAGASGVDRRVAVTGPVARERDDTRNMPLVSPSTDASVASSFQSLATSMFLRDSDLIARTAREMLRPMLKQWLDDNLPVMVERLVRAEIERVARGGR